MGYAITALVLAAVAAALLWLGRRVRARGIGDTISGPIDEIWRPATHHHRQEIRARQEQAAPGAAADDKLSD